MKLEIAHTYDLDPETYAREVHFSDELQARFLGTIYKERRILEREEDDRTMRLKFRVTPNRDIPAAVKKALRGGGLGYDETDRVDKERLKVEWSVRTDTFPDKTTCAGTVSFEDAGAGRCRRVIRGEVKVKVMLVGGLIEKAIVDGMKESFEKSSDITREFIREKYSKS